MTRVAVVGATGAVGAVMRRLLEERSFPADEVVYFASERSAGRELDGRVVQPLRDDTIEGFDIALFSAGGGTSREWSPRFAAAGALVVDNSSAWRMDPDVPLVVSEVNPHELERIPKGIVANPNCTTMAFMAVLAPLHRDELAAQVAPLAADVQQLVDDGASAARKVEHAVHENTLAFNVVPLLGTLDDQGYTDEEMKLQNESRKILSLPELEVTPTCVRVPVMVGHSIAVRATFRDEPDLGRALSALQDFPGLEVDLAPTPLEWAGRNETLVGRVRRDLSDPRVLNFFVVGDNLLKGAALNTVQLAELAVERGLVGAEARAGS